MLPYLNYQNPLKSHHGVPHCLDMCNGFRVVPGPKKRPDDAGNESNVSQLTYNDTALYVFAVAHSIKSIFMKIAKFSNFTVSIHC